MPLELAGRLPGGGRGAAGHPPAARARVHRPAAARPGRARDLVPRFGDHRARCCERLCPAAVIEGRPAAVHAVRRRQPAAERPAPAIGGGGLLRHPGVRAGRAAAAQARRGGGGDRGAVAPGAQRPGGAVPGGRGGHAGGHRRHRHGPEPGRRPGGVRGAAQVRRAPGPRRWRTPSWRRSPGAPAATCATAASPPWSRCRRCRRRRCGRWSATASPPDQQVFWRNPTWIWRRWTGCWRR